MIVFDLILPGPVRDAWLYKGLLLLWDRQNNVVIQKVKSLQARILREYGPGVAAMADFCIWRNDWRSEGPARTLLAVPAIHELFWSVDEPDRRITIELQVDAEFSPSHLNTEDHLLDVQIYANRVFLATTAALFESYIKPEYPQDAREAWPLLEKRVSDVQARHGAVFAAADEAGLWWGSINFDDGGRPSAPTRRVGDDVAHRVSWSARNLLSYTNKPLPDFLRTKGHHVRPHNNARYDAYVVDDVQRETSLPQVVKDAVRDRRRREPDDGPHALGNSNYRLLVAWQGEWQVVDLRAYVGKHLTAAADKAFKRFDPPLDANEVLQTYGLESGFVVEDFDAVHLITASGAHPLLDEQAGRVRTFPDSRRHADVVAVATEDALHLIGHWNVAQ